MATRVAHILKIVTTGGKAVSHSEGCRGQERSGWPRPSGEQAGGSWRFEPNMSFRMTGHDGRHPALPGPARTGRPT